MDRNRVRFLAKECNVSKIEKILGSYWIISHRMPHVPGELHEYPEGTYVGAKLRELIKILEDANYDWPFSIADQF